MIPAADEIQLLEENREKANELTKEEQYLIEILIVPGIKAHLDVLVIKNNFGEQFLNCNVYLKQLRAAIVGVKDNQALKDVMVMLLKIGNYLNQGSKKGN